MRPEIRRTLRRAASGTKASQPAVLLSHPRVLYGLIGVVAVLLVVVGLTHAHSRSQHHALLSLSEKVRALETIPTAPTCHAARDLIANIARQEQASAWEFAADAARTGLADPTLCPDAKDALAEKAVSTELEALLSTPADPSDTAAQQAAVARYQALLSFAGSHGVPLPKSDRQVAAEAYNVELFLLAKHAFESAAASGAIHPADPNHLGFYTDTLYNLGWWWSHHTDDPHRSEGVQLLVAANLLSREHHLGRHQAQAALRDLVGDEEGWPGPASLPVPAPDAVPPARSAHD